MDVRCELQAILFRRSKEAVGTPVSIDGRDEWARAHFLFALKIVSGTPGN
jgi:hypothetical protein